MEILTLDPNPLHKDPQTLEVEKVATLIGQNGSGKSCILQSVFERKLSKRDFDHLRIVCFSSGQNENFSERFSKYLSKERRVSETLNLDCFYFDKSWSKLMIFLATCLYPTGRVRQFLREQEYVDEVMIHSERLKEDTSTKLLFKFRVEQGFIGRVETALEQEKDGIVDTLRTTPYFRSLSSFIEHVINPKYDFDIPLKKAAFEIGAKELYEVSFDAGRSKLVAEEEAKSDEEKDAPATGSVLPTSSGPRFKNNPTVSFFTQAADKDYFIDKRSLKLTFRKGLELDRLSDGEYQLLFLYALIDLFDADETLFLLDEADSHLHYANIDRLWKVLGSIKGKAVTTTHLLDSITANDFRSLKVVERGRISEHDKLKQLIDRLQILSRATTVEYEICAKISHMALLDDYNDWEIFVRLASRKNLDIRRLESVYAFKKASSYRTTTESFGKAKFQWLDNLGKVEGEFSTQQVFLICDRDEAPLEFDLTGVKVCGREYATRINKIHWPKNTRVNVHLLAWKRREIKNYLLSYSVLNHHGVLDQINGTSLAADDHLKAGDPGDNEGIRKLNVKNTINPFINEEGVGLCPNKLQAYIDLIPPEEISEDISNMYNYIVNKL